ncbi:MAG: PEP-utilizing enzyme [Actinomycetota bacterium]|nr:PEP-utilizing enzyme [Actinomycetota bacterium]
MPSAPQQVLSFEAPGPGSWTLDTAHFPQPATRFVIELFPEAAKRGFKEATARYGLLLDYIEWAFVHGWAYLCPRPIWSSEDEQQRLTRDSWDKLVRASPVVGGRLASSSKVFEDRRWREDVALWDEQVKPDMRRRHLSLQSVNPRGLEAVELLSHLERCRENLRRAIDHHHRLNVAPVIPVGDFLLHAQEWTGRPTTELVRLVRAAGPVKGVAAGELERLVEAVRDDPAAAGLLSADEAPGAVLASLLSWPGQVGRATADYLGLVGHWNAGGGSDVSEPTLLELPHVLVATIRSVMESRSAGLGRDTAAEHRADVRGAVPQRWREAFDGLLVEARTSHRVRDERAAYCDVWAYGLARRAILAAGVRLAEAGAIEHPEHLVEANYLEMRGLLDTSSDLSGEELAARARYRQEAREDQVPIVLGDPPRSPVPAEWLPPGNARTERAFRAYVQAMSAEGEAPVEAAVGGLAASPGIHEGRARVIRSPSELARINKGDVLIAGSTAPAFTVVLPLVGAIVTDRGGLLSHAAIVAREYGIPAVVGTGDATRKIPDGALVRVDGAAGEVRVLD